MDVSPEAISELKLVSPRHAQALVAFYRHLRTILKTTDNLKRARL
jgi:hypothetical protein